MLFGILNCTPDSFSDGGTLRSVDEAISAGLRLRDEGADVIDIGGDSTRPSSVCVGPDAEWRRIGPVVEALSRHLPVSVDTHHSAVALRALEAGASYVNDVSGGGDPDMFGVVARGGGKLILMHSASGVAHSFAAVGKEEVLGRIGSFFRERVRAAVAAGIPEHHLVLDPGMGGFLSRDPEVSWVVLRHVAVIEPISLPLLVGVSRKGFLAPTGTPWEERDALSALVATLLKSGGNRPIWIRTHNVKLTRRFLEVYAKLA